jgi:hypothetical protein
LAFPLAGMTPGQWAVRAGSSGNRLGRNEIGAFMICDFDKSPRATGKMLTAWADIGATRAKFNPFMCERLLHELTPIWPGRQILKTT